MKIVNNNVNSDTHLYLIRKLIDESNEIEISVAFLKLSGLEKIFPNLLSKKENCTFFVGVDYYLTEPDAIRKLYNNGIKVFIVKKSHSTFHPKIYYFKNTDDVNLIIGSANMTGGGLETNFEVSILVNSKIGAEIQNDYENVVNYFKINATLIENYSQISQYEREFIIFKKNRIKAEKQFRTELKKMHKLDISGIKDISNIYRNSTQFKENYQKRKSNYLEAHQLLDELTTDNLKSPSEFLKKYEVIAKLFHSSGLLRGKTIFSNNFLSIIDLIKYVKEHKNDDPRAIFQSLRNKKDNIKRYGINAISEVLNTYNPGLYSVANGRIVKSLSQLGFEKFSNPNGFDADTYEKFNTLIGDIAKLCSFDDLGHVDHFLSWYYENYVKAKSK